MFSTLYNMVAGSPVPTAIPPPREVPTQQTTDMPINCESFIGWLLKVKSLITPAMLRFNKTLLTPPVESTRWVDQFRKKRLVTTFELVNQKFKLRPSTFAIPAPARQLPENIKIQGILPHAIVITIDDLQAVKLRHVDLPSSVGRVFAYPRDSVLYELTNRFQ